METAKSFWMNADINALAKHWNYEEKTPYEVKKIMPLLADSKVIWDAACGNGRIADALKNLLPGTKFICTDLNEWDLVKGLYPGAKDADTVLLLGVIKYITNESLFNLLEELSSMKVIVREPCESKTFYVNKISKTLGSRYEAINRSAEDIMALIVKTHDVVDMGRIYPDNLESKYGNIQHLFVGFPC